jgi:hypothetical protein
VYWIIDCPECDGDGLFVDNYKVDGVACQSKIACLECSGSKNIKVEVPNYYESMVRDTALRIWRMKKGNG